MRRDPLGSLLLVFLILGLGVVVWATRYPESRLLERAAEWPVAGPLVERFRARYIPRSHGSTPDDNRMGGGWESGEGAVSRLAERTTTRLGEGFVWIKAGTQLRSEADPQAVVIETISDISRLPVLVRDGDWYRVLGRHRAAWVHLPDYGRDGEPPLGSEPALPKPLRGRPPDPDLLAQAIELLQQPAEPLNLSGYEFYTDLEHEHLVEVVSGIAGNIERAYAGRYGVVPIDRPREAIVLFQREADYRSLQNTLDRLAGLPAVGLVSHGVVAVYVGLRGSKEVSATLVHELVHLLNRRALGPALPAWLDEGMADDLSYSEIDKSGDLVPGELAGSAVDLGSFVVWKGGRAAALELKRALAAARTVPLEELLALEWRKFVDPERRLYYPQSALFVRYLIDSEPELRRGFHAYLEGIAGGESVASEALLGHLGRSWKDLERGFGEWAIERFGNLRMDTAPNPEPV